MKRSDGFGRYLYWMTQETFAQQRETLERQGWKLAPARLTPCEVLRAGERTAWFAMPDVWNRLCARQGSWYRSSARQGMVMVMSADRLPDVFDPCLDAELALSDFTPAALPSARDLAQLVSTEEYRTQRPAGWEKVKWWEGIFQKAYFTITRAWGRGETQKGHWLGQRANHANFLARRHTTRLDGEDVPYSVTTNASVCSSCVEFFNVLEPDARKLVRSCPGSISRGGAPEGDYVDVRPVQRDRTSP